MASDNVDADSAFHHDDFYGSDDNEAEDHLVEPVLSNSRPSVAVIVMIWKPTALLGSRARGLKLDSLAT